MPKHDKFTDKEPDMDPPPLDDAQAERVEGIAKIMAEHLYAQPEDDDEGDNTIWELTSDKNKRIFRSCALEVDQFMRSALV